jgi:hypothetical protein
VALLGSSAPTTTRRQADFPATHGLHAVRGEYTEIQTLDFGNGQYRIESTTAVGGGGGGGRTLAVLVTTVKADPGLAATLNVAVEVPSQWSPRYCNTTVADPRTAGKRTDFRDRSDVGYNSHDPTAGKGPASIVVTSACSGYSPVRFRAATDLPSMQTTTDHVLPTSNDTGTSWTGAASSEGFALTLGVNKGDAVAFYAYDADADPHLSVAGVMTAVRAAEASLRASFATFGSKNETYAGMVTAISWNAIYTPYEGIFTPVFRGKCPLRLSAAVVGNNTNACVDTGSAMFLSPATRACVVVYVGSLFAASMPSSACAMARSAN